MSVERLMAYATPEQKKGRAGGWAQAGNLGGFGLGGGAGLYMAEHFAPWSAGASLGVFALLCCLALLILEEPPTPAEKLHYGKSLVNVGKDVWSIAYSRVGFLTLLLFALPIGTGAASGLWSAVAGDWRADADTVALVNGLLGGLVAIPGSLIGGYLSDTMDRKTSYAVFGVALAAWTVAMAVTPRSPEMFVLFTMGYSFLTGFTFAAFTAVTLETIGQGAAATKYNLLACVANVPIAYLTYLNGVAHKQWGSTGMLWFEASLGVAAVVVFVLVALATRRRSGPTPVKA
jgi:predicted MFS family arabinose efflux permease